MATRVIKIEPVTRIEGHCEIKLILNDEGKLHEAQTKIVETRGYEKFVQGRLIEEMPLILPKMCGICHVPHHVCSGKAVDSAFGLAPTDIPETAFKLRELMHYGSYIHSHVLHFFYLAAPDLVLGPDADPRKRNVFGILEVNPDLVKKVIKARAVGQKITRVIGGKKVHPVTCVPGGQAAPLTPEKRDSLLEEVKWVRDSFLPEALEIANPIFDQYASVVDTLGAIDVGNLGTIKNGGAMDFYDGKLRSMGVDGTILDEFEIQQYFDYIAERIQNWSYLKFPYFKKLGWPDGIYRVGPLGRLNVADYIPTDQAQEMFKEFRSKWGRPINKTMLYNYGRLIEAMFAAEYCAYLLEDPSITSSNVRRKVELREGDGFGCVEAHRGTLIHHYKVNRNGILTDCNLIVATVGNNGAINMAVRAAAFDLIKDGQPSEGLLNRLEMVVRAYDPCFSCATHAVAPGRVATKVEILDSHGKILHTLKNWNSQEEV
jgi:F420-non-reducing hydrogenase large subunit